MNFTIDQHRFDDLASIEFLARQVVEGFIVGLHKSPFHGFSVEFAEHRQYNKGESIRHIDWKLFGRTDKLYVKRYEEETNLRCHLVIDSSASMYFPDRRKNTIDEPNKMVFSIYAAAALMHLMRRQRDAVGLSLVSNRLETHTRTRSSITHHKYLYGLLESLMANDRTHTNASTTLAAPLHEIAENIHRRSLVVIFTDLFDQKDGWEGVFDALQHLKYNKHEIILFHVSDTRLERDLEFQNRPYRFLDMESKEQIKLQPAEVQKVYQKHMARQWENIKIKCGQYQMDLVEADINKGFDQIMLPYLLKRQSLY